MFELIDTLVLLVINLTDALFIHETIHNILLNRVFYIVFNWQKTVNHLLRF